MSIDVKYDFTPHDGTPGKSFEDFEDRLLNYLSREVDDRGWSLADHLLEIDEGGANGPANPNAGADLQKAIKAMRKRTKSSYGFVTKHVLDADHLKEMKTSHFQDGVGAWQYYLAACRPTKQLP